MYECRLDVLPILQRQVLGSSIELVVKYLRRMGIKRHNVGRLLRTFPFDYSVRHLVLPDSNQEEEQQQQQQHQQEEDQDQQKDGSS